jgi:hypothetical protein
MSEETRKGEKAGQEVKAAELSEQELDKVAGGGANAINTSRSNIKDNLGIAPTPSPTNPANPTPTTEAV